MSPFCVILLGFFIVVIVVIVATIRFPLSCCRNKNLRDNMPNYKCGTPYLQGGRAEPGSSELDELNGKVQFSSKVHFFGEL